MAFPKATNSAPEWATCMALCRSLPPMKMQGISTICDHHWPRSRFFGWGSGRIFPRLAKHQIIGAQFTDGQGIVAGFDIARTDDHQSGQKFVDRVFQRRRILSELQAVRANPSGNAALIGDDSRNTTILSCFHQRLDNILKGRFFEISKREDKARHIASGEDICEFLWIKNRHLRRSHTQDQPASIKRSVREFLLHLFGIERAQGPFILATAFAPD